MKSDDPQYDIPFPKGEQTHSEETDKVHHDKQRCEKPIEYSHVIHSYFLVNERDAESGESSKLSST